MSGNQSDPLVPGANPLRITGRVATTHVDSEGDKLTRSALEDLANQINNSVIPVNLNHNPRIPPQGRFLAAEVVELSDGEYAVQADAEIFSTSGGASEELPDSRTLRVQSVSENEIKVALSRGYGGQEEPHRELASILPDSSVQVHLHLQKSIGPIAQCLIIVGGLAVGAIAKGFLEQIGADTWEYLKEQISSPQESERRVQDREDIARLIFPLRNRSEPCDIEVLVSNPSPRDLQELETQALSIIDEATERILEEHPALRRIVFEWDDGSLSLLYGVRKDCLPVEAEELLSHGSSS